MLAELTSSAQDFSDQFQLSSAKYFIGQAQLSSAQRKFFKYTTLAQVRIMRDKNHLKKACEQFFGKKPHEIEEIIVNTFAGRI